MTKKSKEIGLLLLLLALFIAITVYTSSEEGLSYPDYTSFSANENGVALIFDVLAELDYPVARSTNAITPFTDIHSLQIIVCPSYLYTSSEDIANIAAWIERGGKALVYYSEDNFTAYQIRGSLGSAYNASFQNGVLYSHGLGYAFFSSAENITNKTIMDQGSELGYPLIETIEFLGYDTIYFNEAYHGYSVNEGLWRIMPSGLKVMVYELLVITAVILFYLGKRFGRPIPYYEEIQRDENEYVHTLANIYWSAGLGEAAIEMFVEKFQAAAAAYFKMPPGSTLEELYKQWQRENLPQGDKLHYLIANQNKRNNTKKPKGKLEFMKAVNAIKALLAVVSRSL